MTAGDRVIATASKYLGVHEEPDGSNRGPLIDKWAARWSLRGVPWCGIFADAMFAEAGVDDGGLCHPSTAEMCRRARAAGAVWDGHGEVPAGSLWIACGIHTCLIAKDRGNGTFSTVEGNHQNAVGMGLRSVADGIVVIPPAVAADVAPPAPAPIRGYWLEDLQAQPRLFGPWRTEQMRASRLAELPDARRHHVRIVRGHGGGFAWIEGPRRLYGPWDSADARDAAENALEARLGRPLRPFSKTVHGSV